MDLFFSRIALPQVNIVYVIDITHAGCQPWQDAESISSPGDPMIGYLSNMQTAPTHARIKTSALVLLFLLMCTLFLARAGLGVASERAFDDRSILVEP